MEVIATVTQIGPVDVIGSRTVGAGHVRSGVRRRSLDGESLDVA